MTLQTKYTCTSVSPGTRYGPVRVMWFLPAQLLTPQTISRRATPPSYRPQPTKFGGRSGSIAIATTITTLNLGRAAEEAAVASAAAMMRGAPVTLRRRVFAWAPSMRQRCRRSVQPRTDPNCLLSWPCYVRATINCPTLGCCQATKITSKPSSLQGNATAPLRVALVISGSRSIG